jgi:hypothetical protein
MHDISLITAIALGITAALLYAGAQAIGLSPTVA